MEDCKRYLQMVASELFDESSADTDLSVECIHTTITEASLVKETSQLTNENTNNKISVVRLPTRRPDPNILNRNALLARENRRKKKAHLEIMERELEKTRCINRNLLKLLKKQIQIVKKVKQEKCYYKDLVVNQLEMHSLTTTLKNKLPIKPLFPMDLSIKENDNFMVSSEYITDQLPSSCSTSSSSLFEQEPLAMNFDTSEDFEPSTNFGGDWNEIIENKTISSNEHLCNVETIAFVDEYSSSKIDKCITVEHNYGLLPIAVCRHIGQNKDNFDFCPSCHWNTHCTPPTQLLENGMDELSMKKVKIVAGVICIFDIFSISDFSRLGIFN